MSINLEAIRERAGAATPGPWMVQDWGVISGSIEVASFIKTEADANFIVHSREDIPALLAEVERLNSELQLENTQPKPDGKCREDDGCPTENAVLRREWRKLTEQLASTTNIPLDRLETICSAEKDGRLVTLPCKVGDTAYVVTQLFNGSKTEWKIDSRKIDRLGGNEMNPVWMVSTQPYELHFFLSEFGKTVFLTRAEAETALKASNSTTLKSGDDNG